MDANQHSREEALRFARLVAEHPHGYFPGTGPQKNMARALLDLEEQLQPAPFEYRKVFESSEAMVAWLGREEQLETTQRELQAMKDAEATRILTLNAILEREASSPAKERQS